MLLKMSLSAYLPLFKFQYGATNIEYLSSNKAIIQTFKFQYGATNINHLKLVQECWKSFKFQYGATNMCCSWSNYRHLFWI